MGYEVSKKELRNILLLNNNNAIIICANYKNVVNEFKEFYEIPLGEMLSDRLQRYPIKSRNNKILEEMDKLILNNKRDKVLIKDIDILFNPQYKFDVLKYFSNIARVKKVAVVWNGVILDGYLQYSENGYLDYKKYLIKNYDIICIN